MIHQVVCSVFAGIRVHSCARVFDWLENRFKIRKNSSEIGIFFNSRHKKNVLDA